MYIFLYVSISLSKGGRQPITGLLPGPKEVGGQSQDCLRTCGAMTLSKVAVSHGRGHGGPFLMYFRLHW